MVRLRRITLCAVLSLVAFVSGLKHEFLSSSWALVLSKVSLAPAPAPAPSRGTEPTTPTVNVPPAPRGNSSQSPSLGVSPPAGTPVPPRVNQINPAQGDSLGSAVGSVLSSAGIGNSPANTWTSNPSGGDLSRRTAPNIPAPDADAEELEEEDDMEEETDGDIVDSEEEDEEFAEEDEEDLEDEDYDEEDMADVELEDESGDEEF